MTDKILDTNILMDNAANEGIIPLPVLYELDGLKNQPGERGWQARRAIKRIAENENFEIRVSESEAENIWHGSLQHMTVDQQLVSIALEDSRTLVTNDLALSALAEACGVNTESVELEDNEINLSEGVEYISPEEYSEILEHRWTNPNDYKVNTFLIYSEHDVGIDAFRLKRQGDSLVPIRVRRDPISGPHCVTHPRNLEQACLFNLIQDEEVGIVIGTGNYGTGKSYAFMSYLANRQAEVIGQYMDKADNGMSWDAYPEKVFGKNPPRIVVIPNNAQAADTRELAALPGGVLDKELVYLGSLNDFLGETTVREWYELGWIEIIPMSVLRGRNIENAIIYVQEAQNLTREHVKLIVGRVGAGSRVFFDGDIKQTDRKVFQNNNGLVLLNKMRDEGEPLIGTVRLQTIERSAIAQLAERLDELEMKIEDGAGKRLK